MDIDSITTGAIVAAIDHCHVCCTGRDRKTKKITIERSCCKGCKKIINGKQHWKVVCGEHSVSTAGWGQDAGFLIFDASTFDSQFALPGRCGVHKSKSKCDFQLLKFAQNWACARDLFFAQGVTENVPTSDVSKEALGLHQYCPSRH